MFSVYLKPLDRCFGPLWTAQEPASNGAYAHNYLKNKTPAIIVGCATFGRSVEEWVALPSWGSSYMAWAWQENDLPEASTLQCFAGILLLVFAVQPHTPFAQGQRRPLGPLHISQCFLSTSVIFFTLHSHHGCAKPCFAFFHSSFPYSHATQFFLNSPNMKCQIWNRQIMLCA